MTGHCLTTVVASVEFVDKILIFAALEWWLLQLRETDSSFVYNICGFICIAVLCWHMIKIWATEHLQNCNGIIYVNVNKSHLCCSGRYVKVLQIDQSHSWSAVLLEWRNLLFVVLLVVNVNWCLLDSILSYTVKRMRSSTAFKGHINTRMRYCLLHVLSALICIWLTRPVGLKCWLNKWAKWTHLSHLSVCCDFVVTVFVFATIFPFSAKLQQFFCSDGTIYRVVLNVTILVTYRVISISRSSNEYDILCYSCHGRCRQQARWMVGLITVGDINKGSCTETGWGN